MKHENVFARMVKDELKVARNGHGPVRSLHEGYGVLLEEVDEFWNEVKLKKSVPERAIRELVQISAMAQRIAEDVLTGEIEGFRMDYEEYDPVDHECRFAEPEPVDDVVEEASFFQGDLVRKKNNGELCIVKSVSRTTTAEGRSRSYSLVKSNGVINSWYEYDDLELVDVRRGDLWDKWQK